MLFYRYRKGTDTDRKDPTMKNATIKSIEFAADTINDEISNFTPGDLQFGAMLDIVATVVAKRHEAHDDDATFSEIRREILKSLMKDGRWPLTHSCASHYAEFWGIELDD